MDKDEKVLEMKCGSGMGCDQNEEHLWKQPIQGAGFLFYTWGLTDLFSPLKNWW